MGRPKKTEAASAAEEQAGAIVNETEPVEETAPETGKADEAAAEEQAGAEIPDKVRELMRLYPQYEKLWISSRGFVHPEGAAEYLLKDAALYANPFHNK